MDVLYVAEKWGIPPWEIAGEKVSQNTRQTWYKRARFYYNQLLIKWSEDRNGR